MAREAIAVLIGLLGICSMALGAEEFVTLNTRGNATQSYVLVHDPGEDYRFVAILFAGGSGNINLKRAADRGALRGANFLVRTREMFASGGVAAAVIDSPSDRRDMSDAFRISDMHAADVGIVVKDLKGRFPQAKIILVGTSRGTVSAAYVGLALGGEIGGVVLTSSVFNANRTGGGVSRVDFSRFKVPLLFVHHREDGCDVCPYSAAARLADRFPLISVSGGLPPQSGPCNGLSSHGYFGREADTVAAITRWISGKPHATEIR